MSDGEAERTGAAALPASTRVDPSQLWGGRSADGSPIGVAVDDTPVPLPVLDRPNANIHRDDVARVTTPGDFMAAWALAAKANARKKERARDLRRWSGRLLAVAVVAVCAFAAYPRVHTMIVARSVAADLRPYVQGKGVAFAPPGGNYSVRLPQAPASHDAQVVAATLPLTLATRSAVVTGRDYQITVLHADVPGGALPKGVLGALKDPKIGGTGTLADAHPAEVAGETAYVGSFVSSAALPRRVAVVMHHGRLFVIRVQAQQVGPVFDAAVKSFRFTF